jgi:hypothetical protein
MHVREGSSQLQLCDGDCVPQHYFIDVHEDITYNEICQGVTPDFRRQTECEPCTCQD